MVCTWLIFNYVSVWPLLFMRPSINVFYVGVLFKVYYFRVYSDRERTEPDWICVNWSGLSPEPWVWSVFRLVSTRDFPFQTKACKQNHKATELFNQWPGISTMGNAMRGWNNGSPIQPVLLYNCCRNSSLFQTFFFSDQLWTPVSMSGQHVLQLLWYCVLACCQTVTEMSAMKICW